MVFDGHSMSGSFEANRLAMTAELLLVFNQSERPTRRTVHDALARHSLVSVSFDPGGERRLHLIGGREAEVGNGKTVSVQGRSTEWLELLANGMTFDLAGLGPGQAIALPDVDAVFDLEAAPTSILSSGVSLSPGSHLSGGKRTLPVLRGLLAVACEIVSAIPEVQALVWGPAKSVMSAKYFESIASAWLEGGPFPALGMVSYQATSDGALHSVGLSFWLNKELRIEPELANDRVSATRLSTRIVNHLISAGDLEEQTIFTAPDGQTLLLSLSSDQKLIRVSRE